MRRQHRGELLDHPGWAPLEEQEGNAFGQALREAVKAARPRTTRRNVFRLAEGQDVSRCQPPTVEAATEVVQVLPSGVVIRDKRRVR